MESDIKKSYILVLFFTTIVSRILGSELQSEFSVPLELSVTRDVKSTVLGYVTYELTGLVGCAKICFQKPECQSFTHSKSTLQCELYDYSLQSNELRTLKKSVYSEKINWYQNLFSDCGQLSCSLGSSCFNRGNNSTCIPTECGPIPLVANGELNLAYETRVGTLAEYTCDPGTVLEGRPDRRCLTTGEWQPDLFKCHLQCPPTPVVPDAALDDPLRIVGIYTNYTCVNNTVLFGTPQLYCQENQTWTPVQFECIRQCPPAPDVNDATINTTDTIINTTVGYQCHPRADTFGTPNIVCQEDLSWSPVIFNCSRQCPVAEEVTHARKLSHIRQVFNTLEYECINDTLLDGDPTRFCPTTQVWEPIQFTCIEQCPVLDIPHAINDTTSRVLSSVVNYHCANGYLHNGTTQITCQNDRNWTPINFECIEVCPTEAPTVQYANTDQTLRFVGTVAYYTCDPDTIIHGDNYVTCIYSTNSTLDWSTVPFWCEKVCPDSPPIVMDGTLNNYNRSIGALAEYICHNETVLIDGPATIPCLQSQQWGAQTFDCRRQCSIPPLYPNSIVNPGPRTLGETITYNCTAGHMLKSGTLSIFCQNNQEWTNRDFDCFPVCTESPPTVPDGVLTNTDRFVGDVAIYNCINDTVLMNGPAQVECQSDQTWASPTFDCRRQCPVPPGLDNGESIPGPRTLGETISYQCNHLFIMEGTSDIFCMSNQTWTSITFYCRPICPDPPVVADSSIITFNNSINGTADYQCDNETVLLGGLPILTCLPSQTWSTIHFECRRQCSIPPIYPNSIVNPGPRTLGETITYNCTAGHKLKSGTLSIFCQNNQEWTNRDFDCFPICVESPPTVPDGVLTNTDRFVGDVAIYSCINDTVLMNGPVQVECQSDQTWASPTFDCRRQCPVPPSLDNGESIPGPRTLGETISYQCNHLFIMEGTPDIFCMANQTWTSITFYCRPICPDPPVVADSSIIIFNNSINGTADYQCDNETVLLGGLPILTCLPSQTWSTTHFECRRQCAFPDPQPNTEPITVPARTIGTILNYTCITQHDVYPLTETPQIICQDNQQWLIPFECKPVCTDSPPTIPDGVLTNTDRFVGDVAIYSCINDTVLMNGPAQVECQSDQTWASPIFDCRRQCPVPPSLDDGESIPGPRTLGETISYQCNDLFIMEGTPDIFCMSNQTWTSIAFYCRPICPDPPVVADSSIITFNNSINGTADYQCDNETVLLGGLPILTCLPSQTWSTIYFECRRQCAVPDPQPNTEPITIPARTIGTILNYTCITQHDVYPLTETPQIICQENQQWLIPFECKPVCVESPPVVPDGNLTTTDRFVGDVAIYSCINDTVLMNGPAQVECQSNQTWASPTFDCRRQCPIPPSLDNGESIPGPRTLGETISYQCNHLFTMEGTPDIFCMSNQTWTPVSFYCRPVCPDPPVVAGSSIITFNNSINGTADYQCDNETVLIDGPALVICLHSQNWSVPQFECRRQCAEPSPIPNTNNITVPARTIGTILNYTCITQHDVYPLTEAPQIICQDNQQWLISFECKPVCEEVPSLVDANLTTTDRFVGDVAIYSCINDTVLMNGPAQVECQSNQTWASPTFDCRRQCPEPPTIQHTEPVITDLTIGTIYNYTCITGYQPTAIPQITCQQNQQWSVVQFECRPVCVESPPVVPDGNLTTADRFVGDVAIYSCINDTVLMNGPAQVECQSNQTWASPTFDCRRQCPEPPIVPNTNPLTGSRVIGSSITFICITGYEETSNTSITCQQDGNWSQISFECQPVCDEPPTILNTTALYNNKFVGSNVTYECDSGLTQSGNPTITCQANTTWSSIDFSCD